MVYRIKYTNRPVTRMRCFAADFCLPAYAPGVAENAHPGPHTIESVWQTHRKMETQSYVSKTVFRDDRLAANFFRAMKKLFAAFLFCYISA